MAPHSSTLAWKIPWTEEPGRLQSMGSLGVGHGWATSLSLFTFTHWRRKWQPTPVFLPGESQGPGSLVGWRLWSRTESDDWIDLAAAAAGWFPSCNSRYLSGFSQLVVFIQYWHLFSLRSKWISWYKSEKQCLNDYIKLLSNNIRILRSRAWVHQKLPTQHGWKATTYWCWAKLIN